MPALSIQVPYPVFYDRDGVPLDNGNIYIGVANLDPVTNPLQVYYDEALTLTASQPLKTSNGYIYRNGTPAQVYVDATDFSISVRDNSDLLVYNFPTASGIGTQAAGITYNEGSPSAIDRTVESRLQDEVSVKDFGVNGAAIQDAIDESDEVFFPAGSYNNTQTVTLPFGKTFVFDTNADISNTGAGATVFEGVTIRKSYNPDGWLGWTSAASENFEGLSADLSGYGSRSFSGFNTPSAIAGSTNIPSTSTLYAHANATSGWIKNSSLTTGGVAVYGQADREVADALVWGLNTRSQDNGFGGLNVWGYELDMNIDNVTTTALGLDLVGGSTVEPNLSIAVNVQPIGIFETPKKRWRYAFRSTDAAAIFGIELGARLEAASSESQTLSLKYRNASNVQEDGLIIGVDSNGNALIKGGSDSENGILAFQTFGSSLSPFAIQDDKLGFYGSVPAVKPTITGSRGGNAALASLLIQLEAIGLITDGTSA